MARRANRKPNARPPKKTTARTDSARPLSRQIWNWAFENIALTIAAGLISTAVGAGAAYVLWGARSDRDQILPVMVHFQRQGDQIQAADRMMQIMSTGWFDLSNGNLTRVQAIINRLKDEKFARSLDATFAKDTLTWCQQSLIKLTREQGYVESFVFDDELLKAGQRSIAGQYAAFLRLVDTFQKMISGWNGSSIDVRNLQFDAIVSASLDAARHDSAETNIRKQALTRLDRMQAEDRNKYEAARGELNKIWWKLNLSLVGLILALLVCIASSAVAIQRGWLEFFPKNKLR